MAKDLIESPRLHLSAYQMADAQEVFECITPAVARFMPWDPPDSVAEVRDRHAARLRAGTDTEQQFVVRLLSSGRCLGLPGSWECRLPLANLTVTELAPGVAQLTYDSIVRYDDYLEHGHRSSIWLHDGNDWRLRFHQGTPFVPTETEG